jgi:farnesyl-diphosphate farnesyltransferase
MLKTPEVFRFCAIPQVMAIATLEEVFDNPKVFTGVVKIRKGLTARLLLDSGSLDGVYVWFNRLARRIASRCPKNDPSREKILKATTVIVNLTQKRATATEHKLLAMHIAVLFAICAAVMAFFFPKALGLQMK